MAASSLQDVSFRSYDVPDQTRYLDDTLQSQSTQRKWQEKVMASRSGDVWWKIEPKQLVMTFAELLHIYSDKTATSLKVNALVAYPVHVASLNSMEKSRGT